MTGPSDHHPRPVILDACVALNLLASGVQLTVLAEAFTATFVMARLAADEVLWLDPVRPGDPREEVDVHERAAAGQLAIIEMSEPEQSAFVDLARVIDDGEAATIAIALERGMEIGTDDRKARRVLSEQAVQVPVWRTSDLISAWADRIADANRVRRALAAIGTRARFRPSRDDPKRDWWLRSLGGGG